MSVDSSTNTGKWMAMIAWVIGMALLTQVFGFWEQKQVNPNSNPNTDYQAESRAVSLEANRQGHYRFTGSINGKAVDFLVDTGATDVVIPKAMANTMNLPNLGQGFAMTANGMVELERTRISELSIGDIKLYNVAASVNPGMSSTQPVLLGMSALSRLDIQQSLGQLTLIQHHR